MAVARADRRAGRCEPAREAARREAAAQALASAITVNRRQAAFASRVEAGDTGKATPSYVDCAM